MHRKHEKIERITYIVYPDFLPPYKPFRSLKHLADNTRELCIWNGENPSGFGFSGLLRLTQKLCGYRREFDWTLEQAISTAFEPPEVIW